MNSDIPKPASLSWVRKSIKIKMESLSTTIYKKSNDRRNFLHSDSGHPKLLKNSISFIQGLRIKRICTETLELDILKISKVFSPNGLQA